MAFREKSAWVMMALMAAAGLYYLNLALGAGQELGAAAPPVSIFIPFTLVVIIGSVAAQTILALMAPREAAAPADERERPLLDRAGHWSGILLAAGAASALLHFFFHGDGMLLFHMIMGSLILSQIAEYALQIALIRRAS